jgi:DNA primase
MKATWVNFRTVKARITMEVALASYGVMLRRVDASYLRGRCPLPTHSSKSNAQSFIVNTEKNAWVCHSDSCTAARSGRPGGNVLDFVACMEGCSIRDAALRLQDLFGLNVAAVKTQAIPARGDRPPVDLSPTENNPPLSFSLTGIDIHHSYLKERGITAETAEYFGIGLFSRNGLMANRIVVPIHNEDGLLVAYAGWALDQTEPKYLFPARFRKSLVLFNLHRAAQCGPTVVLVEGFFDCLNVHQAGLPCAVALMGCNLSRHQEQLLEKYFREVIVLMDGDKAGRRAGAAIAARLVSKVSTRLVEIPIGSQPDQLGGDQIRCLCIPGYF